MTSFDVQRIQYPEVSFIRYVYLDPFTDMD